MSAAGRNLEGHDRHEDDFYATPAWCVRAILPHLEDRASTVLDPCCGEGAILDVVAAEWSARTVGLELDAGRAAIARRRGHVVDVGDALAASSWPSANAIVTNPPYLLASDFIACALVCAVEAAFLLRINFLGAQKRAAFHREHPADVYVLPRRPGFALALSCSKKKGGCGWGVMLPLDPVTEKAEGAPDKCPTCGHELQRSSSDATEYAWFVWGPKRQGGHWQMLDVESRKSP